MASTDFCRIIIAPDSFKGTWSAHDAAAIIAAGWREARPADVIDLCPIADGGEGTLDAVLASMVGRVLTTEVTGPCGSPHRARWGWIEHRQTAVIEMAEASGLHLVPNAERDPMRTTTYGTGELIRAAIDRGAREIVIGIGGSATCDGGSGMAQALGVRFRRADGSIIESAMTGGRLLEVSQVSGSAGPLPTIRVMCDVTSPLCGERGAAHVFGPQKGATPEQVDQLDAALARLVQLLGDRAVNVAGKPGAGAAGGLGFGLSYWCDATLKRGIDLVLDAIDFDARLRDARVVVTGEGRLDASSFDGKAMTGIAARAERLDVPCLAVVGSVAPDCPTDASVQTFVHVEAATGTASEHTSDQAALRNAARCAANWWSRSNAKPQR